MEPTPPLSSLPLIRALIVTMVTVSIATLAAGFPKGAPQYVCGSMKPLHPGKEQDYDPQTFPYHIAVSGGTGVTPGSLVTVTVRGKEAGETLKGLLVTAVDSGDHSVTGLTAPPGAPLQLLNCTRSKMTVPDSGLTHTQRLDSNNVTFHWRVPDQAYVGDTYRIRVTVVKTVYVYWVGINTTLTVTNAAPPTATTTTTTYSPEMTSPTTETTSRLPTSPEIPSGGGLSRLSGSLLHQARPSWQFLASHRFWFPSRFNLVMAARPGSFGSERTNVDLGGRRWGLNGGQGYGWNGSGGGMSSWVSAWFGR